MRVDNSDTEYPHCPVCGKECSIIYKNISREIVGCDECIRETDAWEEDECFSEGR